jgi:sec-independent protein translocase protein TatC
VVIFVLARFGLVSAKFLIKNFKYAVLIIFVIAAVASPGGEVVSQMVFAAPMLVLYVISIGVAWIFAKKKPAEDAA